MESGTSKQIVIQVAEHNTSPRLADRHCIVAD